MDCKYITFFANPTVNKKYFKILLNPYFCERYMRKISIHKLILVLCGIPFLCLSQQPVAFQKNLVPNGSFENYKKKSGNLKQAIPWQPIASVDYYQEPVSGDTSLQKGARTGNCYTGLRFQKYYKEFLQVKLAEALHPGTTYYFEMYVRMGFWSNVTLKSLGALFTKVGYKGQGDVVKGSMVDSVCKKGGFINNYQWFKISGKYIANGGEKYITIGNFNANARKEMSRLNIFKFGFKEAYYFFDDISLIKAVEPVEKVKVEIVGSTLIDRQDDSVLVVKKDLKVGEKIQLKNIFFENYRYYILPESYSELNKLVQYLIRNPTMEVQINGHSDNQGSRLKNQKISEQRAREVFVYLIKKGVQNKMYFKGYGGDLPIATNDTDEGRAKNRRVEFEIIKK